MKKWLTLILSLVAVFSANAGWNAVEGKSWDFDEIYSESGETKITQTGNVDGTTTVGSTEYYNGTGSFEGLGFYIAKDTSSYWLRYSGQGMYCYTSGERAIAIYGLTKGQRVYVKMYNEAIPTAKTNLTDVDGADDYTFLVSEDGNVAFNAPKECNITSITVMEYVDEGETYTGVTFKYVDEDGKELKNSTSRSLEVGGTLTLSSNEMADIWFDNTKYIYKSSDLDDSATVTESMVVTLTFRKAETYTYLVKTTNPNNDNYASGSIVEGETDYVYFPAYMLSDGKFTSHSAYSSEYRLTITPTANYTTTLEYVDTDIENVVFYSEAEDIDGLTKTDGSSASIRCSMGYGAYPSSDTTLTSLEPGKYKLTVSTRGGGARDYGFEFCIGSETVYTTATLKGYNQTGTSDEFTVTETGSLVVKEAGSNNDMLDYLYIVKTGNAEIELTEGESYTRTVDIEGVDVSYTRDLEHTEWQALFIPFDAVIEDARVCKFSEIQYEDGELVLVWEELEETIKVSANTPYIIKPESSEITISATNTTLYAADTATNVATSTSGSVTAKLYGNYSAETSIYNKYSLKEGNFYLYTNSSAVAKPYRIILEIEGWTYPTEGSSASSAPAKATGSVAQQTVRNVIRKAGETSGVQSIAVDGIGLNDGAIYNLQGQRVANPAKGQVYIINGKKVAM